MIHSLPSSPLFVAVGHNGLRIVSENGADWKHLQLGKEGDTYRAVRCGNGRFVALGSYGGDNILASSADGSDWKTDKKDAKYSKYFRGLSFGDSKFLALGGDPGSVGSAAPFALTSTDGIAWSEPIEIGGGFVLRRADWGNGRWVGVGDRGRRATSTDGKVWKDAPDGKAVDTLIDVVFGNGLFVGVGLHGLRRSTEDGLKWSAPLRGEEGEHLNSVVWAGDRFVAVGAGATYSSANGVDWKREANEEAPLAVAFGGGLFVGTNWKGRLLRSTDGIQWKQVHRTEHHVEAICFGRPA